MGEAEMSVDDVLEAAAKRGYETMIRACNLPVEEHAWEKQPENLRADWRQVAAAVTSSLGVRALLTYYASMNAVYMRQFEQTGHWSDAASETRRFEKQLRYALAGEDPLQDDR